jgi:AcrR family transcriptional regulator
MSGKTKTENENTIRERLLEAGLKLFGLHGFEATSTRELAAEAGANLGAILYHFGGKEGIYHAVIEQAVAEKLAEISPCMEEVRRISADPAAGPDDLRQALRTLITTLVAVMLGNPRTQAFAQIMIQEQIAPTPAYDMLYLGFFDRVQGMWAQLVARLTGLPRDCTELKLRTMSIMGQFIIFRMGMTATLRHLGCDRLSQEHLDCIVAIGMQQVEAIVTNATPVCGEDRT